MGIGILDQLSKSLVRSHLVENEMIPITDFFNLVRLHNSGAAWGMLADRNLFLGILATAIVLGLLILHEKLMPKLRFRTVILGLFLGGVIGNLADRISFGHVTDFLDFHLAGHHWPSFNIADSSICIAMGLYLYFSLRYQHEVQSRPKCSHESEQPEKYSPRTGDLFPSDEN